MDTPPFKNWNDSAVSNPAKVARARSAQDLVNIVRGSEADYPSPVRVAGHLHSMNECFATTGTQVFLEGELEGEPTKCQMNADGTVTVWAGVRMLDIARFLRPRGLQLPVMPEIGNATAGSVACCGTKDSSVGAGPGQVSSAVVAVKMVKADGQIETVGPDNPQRMREIRSSYGLLGILAEVTFKTEPRQISLYTYEMIDLAPDLPTPQRIRVGVDGVPADAVLGLVQPYGKRILVERRKVIPGADANEVDTGMIKKRSYIWANAAVNLVQIASLLSVPPGALDLGNQLFGLYFEEWQSGFRASRPDCMIDFRPEGPYFDFTFWAFPVTRWSTVVPAYLDFVDWYKTQTRTPLYQGFQASLFTEIYFIAKDQENVLSFSESGDVFTLDMVDHRPNDPLWRRMNQEFNAFAVHHGGCPLLNQTKELTRCVVQQTLGARWTQFMAVRALDDPNGRFLNAFFAAL